MLTKSIDLLHGGGVVIDVVFSFLILILFSSIPLRSQLVVRNTKEKGGQYLTFEISSMSESVLYRLKNLNNQNEIAVFKEQFKIGRATTNDLSLENNRYISSYHCALQYEHGHLYICDKSSNGTLINRSKKINKNDPRAELHSGDVVHLVFRKDDPESNVIFQIDLPPLTEKKDSLSFDEDTQPATYPSIPPLSPIRTEENEDQSVLMNTSPDVENKPAKDVPKKEFAMEAGDDMEDVLTCVCCQEIMTNPISLEPCLHAFCSDCFASWEAVQRSCPKCRVKVIGKKKNFVINGILEAYLKAYPHKRPHPKECDEDDLPNKKAKNAKHEVGLDGMYVHNTQYGNDDYDDDDEEMEEESESSDGDSDNGNDTNNYIFAPVVAPPVANVRFACRQCPQAGLAAAATYQCPLNQNHILCQCCIQPMPDRRDEAGIHQHCEVCQQFFCHMYFQNCQRAGCLGCLNHLRDLNFNPRHLTNLVNDNPVESQIVQDYLTINQKTIRDLLIECCDRLDRREFTCPGIYRHLAVPSSKVVCYQCGLKFFRDLAYQFRLHMKQADIHPLTMRQRADCYYGKKCRTQYTKLSHAQNLNHACDQTKF